MKVNTSYPLPWVLVIGAVFWSWHLNVLAHEPCRPTSTESTAPIGETTPSINWPTSSWDPPPIPPGISDEFCKDREDGFLLRYPFDCQAYINCTNAWPVLNYCTPDKVFNPFLKICDSPETAHCEELPMPSSTTQMTSTSTTP